MVAFLHQIGGPLAFGGRATKLCVLVLALMSGLPVSLPDYTFAVGMPIVVFEPRGNQTLRLEV